MPLAYHRANASTKAALENYVPVDACLGDSDPRLHLSKEGSERLSNICTSHPFHSAVFLGVRLSLRLNLPQYICSSVRICMMRPDTTKCYNCELLKHSCMLVVRPFLGVLAC
jgi:hypothetical protein